MKALDLPKPAQRVECVLAIMLGLTSVLGCAAGEISTPSISEPSRLSDGGVGGAVDTGASTIVDAAPNQAGLQRCIDVDPRDLEPCCDVDEAHCVPANLIPQSFQRLVGECAGGLCVPDKIIASVGQISLKACQAFGQAGRCLSLCVSEVSEQAALLPDDVCDPGEKCVPCISPLDNMPTGVCDSLVCGGGGMTMMPQPPPPQMHSCDNPPTGSIIDPNTFPPCCNGAHCVPRDAVPPEQQQLLGLCDDGLSFCVPDVFIESGGFHTPVTCDAGGAEGRCLSTCIPRVREQIDLLRTDICAADERCVPCCDPRTGEETQVCGVACDAQFEGTCEEPVRCCGDVGTCLNRSAVPEDLRSNLKSCRREGRDNQLCVPDEVLDPNWRPQRCIGENLLGEEPYEGVCLPDCLQLPFEFVLDMRACADGYICAPCIGPFGGPTNAPGCD